MQENTIYFCVVDYHAITVKMIRKIKTILNVVKVYLASYDPKKSTIFLQSQISAYGVGLILNDNEDRRAYK